MGKFTVLVSILGLPPSPDDDGTACHENPPLLVGIGAAQKGSGSKPAERRPWVVSFVVGILIALLIVAGAFILLVSQQ
jgi:hypothetical protein